MEPRGGKRWQPVANRIVAEASDGKEGVDVRVRQRALQKPRKVALLLSGALAQSTACGGMEPVMEPSEEELSRSGATNSDIPVKS
jgi:hypothetical protein